MRTGLVAVAPDVEPLIQSSQDEKFGDYQCNAAMGLAKKLGKKPREVAESIVAELKIDDLCEPPTIAGPGFINFRLKPEFLARQLSAVPSPSDPTTNPPVSPLGTGGSAGIGIDATTDRIGISATDQPQVVVVDLSSPNLAKEMHVGHLRSTVIGDCVARVLEFMGHEVIRENHVGDWGTQFGMLLAYLRLVNPDAVDNPDHVVIRDLESFYVEAKTRFDADEKFKEESRETVVALQKGDETARKIWKAFCHESLRHCHAIYRRLGVRLTDRGESFYNELMDEVVRRLEAMRNASPGGVVRDSEGALCVFTGLFKGRDGEELPVIARKSDGGFNYTTSDLATIIHRAETLRASRIVYVVGLSQKQHFEMLFAAARKVGFVAEGVKLEHLGFGNVLNKSGSPFKTREGGTVKLKDILDEAVARARRVVETQSDDELHPTRNFTPQQMDEIAERVGLAAVKYYDLSHSMTSDYRFDLDSMCSLEGNTAPYMLYAYARIASIGRKAGVDFDTLPADAPIALTEGVEIALAKKILQFADVIEVVARELRPNLLTDYLYDLAKSFSRFYDRKLGVRVVDASPDSVRMSRLRLCSLTARVLRLGLNLLGIQTIEQM